MASMSMASMRACSRPDVLAKARRASAQESAKTPSPFPLGSVNSKRRPPGKT